MILIFVASAWAVCFYDELDTRVEPRDGGLVRRDRWSIYVETGRAECAALPFEDDGSTLVDVRIRIRHPDEHTRRPDFHERWEVLAPDEVELRPGAVLHLPELRFGDTVEIELERRYEAPALVWRPAEWGPVGRARLAWAGAAPTLHLDLDTPEPGMGEELAWTFVGVRSAELTATFGTPVERTASVPAGAQAIERAWTIRPDLTRAVVETRTAHLARGAHVVIPIPADARDVRCLAAIGTEEWSPLRLPRGCGYVADSDTDVVVGAEWSLPDAAIGGGAPIRTRGPVASFVLDVQDATGEISLVGSARVLGAGPHVLAQARDLAPVTPEGVTDPVVSWRIVRHDETSVLASRAAALAVVARRAVRASIPEPALPSRMRYARADLAAIDSIVAHVREQVRPGTLPDTSPVLPRKLMRARRSGWATPWEMALLLTRYLRQAHADAVPMMVRSPRHGPADPWNPWTYGDGAVVRVRQPEGDLWIDPACLQCAVGEIAPELWGGDVLDDTLTELPPAPVSSQTREYALTPHESGWSGSVHVALSGPAAVRLRTAMADVRLRDRSAWLAAHFGGTTLATIDGLDPGAVLAFDVDGVRVSDLGALRLGRWEIARAGEPNVRLPIEGSEEVIVRGVTDAAPRHVEQAGLRYDRRVISGALVERIDVANPIVARTDALAFLAAVGAP